MEELENLGLTHAESKVYVELLKLGSAKAGKLIEKTGLQSSTVHHTLSSLIEKGYVTYIQETKFKTYQAVDPRVILKIHEEKEKKFKEIIPDLLAMQTLTREKPIVKVFQGLRGLKSMYDEFIEDSKKGDQYFFYSADIPLLNEDMVKFYAQRDAKRKEKRLVVKGLSREGTRDFFKNRKHLQVRYTKFPLPSSMNLCNDKMIIVNWQDKPSGILIKSKQIVESHIKFFKEIWKVAKP
jgi:sugar-specific transcriptional regulator TrmB